MVKFFGWQLQLDADDEGAYAAYIIGPAGACGLRDCLRITDGYMVSSDMPPCRLI